MSSYDLISSFVDALMESAARHGVNIAMPPPSTHHTPHHTANNQWTGDDFARIMRIVGTRLDDALFGLAPSRVPAKSLQFGVELMVLSDTLGAALDRHARFYQVLTDKLRLDLDVKGSKARLEIIVADSATDPRNFLAEWYATRMLGLVQWLIGHEISQVEVEFAHPRQLAPHAYISALGEHVAFDRPANRIIFPSRYLDRRVIRDVKDIAALSAATYDPEHQIHLHRTWSILLKSSLRSSLHRMAPLPTMEDLAREFGVSSQTLRRGLKAEGTSYRQIKAQARHEVVVHNISDTTLTLGQISVLAGFAETNGLVRAMRSWTGLSLSAFRRSVIAGEGDETDETGATGETCETD